MRAESRPTANLKKVIFVASKIMTEVGTRVWRDLFTHISTYVGI